MLEKYVDERWPRAIDYPQRNGTVHVCEVNDKFGVTVPASDAEKLLKAYNDLQDALTRCAVAFDAADHEAFRAFWYGSELEPRPC